MRIVFMGTPEFSVPTFQALLDQGHEIVACYTQPPRPAGRGQSEKKSPVHLAAVSAGVQVFTPVSLKGEYEQQLFASHQVDVAIVVAYGLLLPIEILQTPKFGCLNLHGSNLPRWRGAAPIQRAIMAGDKSTAIQVMQMDEGLDTGPVAMSAEIAVPEQMSAGQLHDEMMVVGAGLMVEAIKKLQQGELKFLPQSTAGVSYAKKISKSEARIDWDQSNMVLHNLIRGLSPFPGAWTIFQIKGKPVRVKILQAKIVGAEGKPGEILNRTKNQQLFVACATGAIEILRVQRAGGGLMSAKDFIHGAGELSGPEVL